MIKRGRKVGYLGFSTVRKRTYSIDIYKRILDYIFTYRCIIYNIYAFREIYPGDCRGSKDSLKPRGTFSDGTGPIHSRGWSQEQHYQQNRVLLHTSQRFGRCQGRRPPPSD